jgi:hypothetical protein
MKPVKHLFALLALFFLQSFSLWSPEGNDTAPERRDDSVNAHASAPLYESLGLASRGLSLPAFESALTAMHHVRGRLNNINVITIADFSQPSTNKRLYVIDLDDCQVLFQSHVAHGRNSGDNYARFFSDEMSSYQSSAGCYVTAETYSGEHGYSLRLDGLEAGINGNARERAIVMHGAGYVSAAFIREYGRLGRSFGCPAVPEELATPIINTIKGGTCLFIYSADENYHRRSALMNSPL